MLHHTDNLSLVDKTLLTTPELGNKAKDFSVHDERLFRRAKFSIRFVPHIEMRESILKRLHGEAEIRTSIQPIRLRETDSGGPICYKKLRVS